mmetsp:Transcript_34698/g.70854  ORF Transcript_34698/g.70854 Transcript_34698/m.70854 type:complete len:244 (+) Transcript_34698:636-1367(+)
MAGTSPRRRRRPPLPPPCAKCKMMLAVKMVTRGSSQRSLPRMKPQGSERWGLQASMDSRHRFSKMCFSRTGAATEAAEATAAASTAAANTATRWNTSSTNSSIDSAVRRRCGGSWRGAQRLTLSRRSRLGRTRSFSCRCAGRSGKGSSRGLLRRVHQTLTKAPTTTKAETPTRHERTQLLPRAPRMDLSTFLGKFPLRTEGLVWKREEVRSSPECRSRHCNTSRRKSKQKANRNPESRMPTLA